MMMFRKLAEVDLPLMHRWLNMAHLRDTYAEGRAWTLEEVQSCVITPLESNKPALRAYEKAGFAHVRTFDHPDEPGPVYMMKKERGVEWPLFSIVDAAIFFRGCVWRPC